MSMIPIMALKGRTGGAVSPVSHIAGNSTIASEQYYNAFPKPALLPDGRLVSLYKRSVDHASAGPMMLAVKQNAVVGWTKAQMYIGATGITAGSMELGVLTSGRLVAAMGITSTSVKFVYTDNLGMDWVDAGTISVPAGYTWVVFGNTNITGSGTILIPVYLTPTDNTVNPYVGRFFQSTDNGVSWSLGATVASQMKPLNGETGNEAIAAGRGIINEFSPIKSHVGVTDATTKMVALFRNESYNGFMHYRSADGGATWSRTGNWSTNCFAVPIANRPVSPILYNGLIYIFCGNRAANDYGIEYITCTPDQFYNNDYANYSAVTRIYNAIADTIASDVDFGYPVPFIDAYGQLCCQFYDANPAYLAPTDWEDVKQIVVIPN